MSLVMFAILLFAGWYIPAAVVGGWILHQAYVGALIGIYEGVRDSMKEQ